MRIRPTAGNPHSRRHALSPRRLEMGTRRGAHWLRTAGSPKADFLNTVGKATMRRCCCIPWDWARPLIRCPRAATPRGLRRTGGNTFTDMITFTPGRCSRTSSRISGSIFAAFRTRSCASRASTISRTAVALRMCNNSTRWTTRSSSPAMAAIAGGKTASDGPGPDTIKVSGIERQFFDYLGRGVPYGPDDGTIAPWAVVTSLPFAPEIRAARDRPLY